MGINIISQSTEERREEIKELFEKIKPLLDEGYNYSTACMKVKNTKRRPRIHEGGWFRDIIEYGESRGYAYKNHSFNSYKIHEKLKKMSKE